LAGTFDPVNTVGNIRAQATKPSALAGRKFMRDSIESVRVSSSRNTFWLLKNGVVVLRGF